jgi:MFS family permease
MGEKSNRKGWVVSLTGALFFFYAFIQANVMTPLNSELLREFGAGISAISLLSAWYFYANIIFIIPAGLLLDRFPVRKLMIIGIFFAIFGTLLFAFANNLFIASLGRFFCGIMMSFGLISCLKLASLWLPPNRMALASSLIITIGMIGGVFAQRPMAMLVENFGWRKALFLLAILGVVIALILWFVVKDRKGEKESRKALDEGILKSLKEVFKCSQNWYCGFFTSLLNLPVAILGALFGITYLTQARSIGYLRASTIVSMLFFGMILGSPFFGWLSDYLKKRKLPMYLGSVCCLVSVLVLLLQENLNIGFIYFLFFATGFTSASQVLGYPVISESNPVKTTGTALSLAALIIMGLGYGVGLPFIGWLLDVMFKGRVVDGVNFYSYATYQKAFLAIPIGIAIGIVMVFLMKETNCKSITKK